MVMLVWWILSLFGICEFTWLVVAIDFFLGIFLYCINGVVTESTGLLTIGLGSIGCCLFAVCKFFFGLTLNGWWILLAPVWLAIAAFLPGGFTLTNYLLQKFGLMTVPLWVYIVGAVVDVFYFVALIYALVSDAKQQKKK